MQRHKKFKHGVISKYTNYNDSISSNLKSNSNNSTHHNDANTGGMNVSQHKSGQSKSSSSLLKLTLSGANDECDCKHEVFHRIISIDGNSFEE